MSCNLNYLTKPVCSIEDIILSLLLISCVVCVFCLVCFVIIFASFVIGHCAVELALQ